MNAQEILENLAKLESNLQNVESARKQVAALTGSYEATEQQLQNVALNISSISNDLNTIFAAIKNNAELKTGEIDAKIKTIIDTLNNKLIVIKSDVDKIKDSFENDCTAITGKLNSCAESSIAKIQSGVNDIISTLNTSASNEIQKLASIVDTFQEKANAALSDQKKSLDEITSQFNEGIQGHLTAFNDIKVGLQGILDTANTQNEEFLKKLSSEIKKISKTLEEHRQAAVLDLEAKFSNLNYVLEFTTTKLNTIETTVSDKAEKITETIKEKNRGLATKLTELNSKMTEQTGEIKSVKGTIGSHSGQLTGEVSKNRKLIILLLLVSSASLLFNLAKLVM